MRSQDTLTGVWTDHTDDIATSLVLARPWLPLPAPPLVRGRSIDSPGSSRPSGYPFAESCCPGAMPRAGPPAYTAELPSPLSRRLPMIFPGLHDRRWISRRSGRNVRPQFSQAESAWPRREQRTKDRRGTTHTVMRDTLCGPKVCASQSTMLRAIAAQ